jgi:hypothetical protein
MDITDIMGKEVESYKLGAIQVVITESDKDNRLHVDCNDGTYHSEFTVRKYEYDNYKRHMNKKITTAYKNQYESDEDESGDD